MKKKKRVLLGASYSQIEPLGLLYLSTIARQEGWEPKIALAEEGFKNFGERIKDFQPEMIGFTIYTGNHTKIIDYFDKVKRENPEIVTIAGGPHATYFPQDCLNSFDYVVISEGLNSFRRILNGKVKSGIVELVKQEPFPNSDRKQFYRDYPTFKSSPIKSTITQTGCPYSCNYCYNSSKIENISGLDDKQRVNMETVVGASKRLFPSSIRDVKDIIKEIGDIQKLAPETRMIFFQDDVFVKMDYDKIKELSEELPRLGINFHAQIRFEYANPRNPNTKGKLELMRKAGCTGLTLAIESADPIVRIDVLNRNMKEELMFDVFSSLGELGYKVRTEQMLGLPCGATKEKTLVGIESDLKTLELNIRLKEATGLPTMAWASIFAPYRGTKIAEYCKEHGFYYGDNRDTPNTFFERSVLNFPREWVGENLSQNTKGVWMEGEELELHRDKIQILADDFIEYGNTPNGHVYAKKLLERVGKDFTFDEKSRRMGIIKSETRRRHYYDSVLYF
ncbi:MAG: cobalamin-dependent protein [Nanoarchaeota archaeon]